MAGTHQANGGSARAGGERGGERVCIGMHNALKDGKAAASMDSGHIAPFGAASAKQAAGKTSKWAIIKKEVVKKEAAFVDFTKQVMALAAQKYNDELDQLCDLFVSSTHSFSTGTKLELAGLHNQTIHSSSPTHAQARRSPQSDNQHASPVPLSPTAHESSSSSEADDEEFWRNRRKNLGGTLVRGDSDDSFVAMSETPPPPEHKPVTPPAVTSRAQGPPPETPAEVVENVKEEERPLEKVVKRWEPQAMKKKVAAFKAQEVLKLKPQGTRPAANMRETSKQDEDQHQTVEVAKEGEVQECDDALTEGGEANSQQMRQRRKQQQLERMNHKDRVAVSTKLALQAIIKRKTADFGHLDPGLGEKLFEKIKTGLNGIACPDDAVDDLSEHVCSLDADDWHALVGSTRSPPALVCSNVAIAASMQQILLSCPLHSFPATCSDATF